MARRSLNCSTWNTGKAVQRPGLGWASASREPLMHRGRTCRRLRPADLPRGSTWNISQCKSFHVSGVLTSPGRILVGSVGLGGCPELPLCSTWNTPNRGARSSGRCPQPSCGFQRLLRSLLCTGRISRPGKAVRAVLYKTFLLPTCSTWNTQTCASAASPTCSPPTGRFPPTRRCRPPGRPHPYCGITL